MSQADSRLLIRLSLPSINFVTSLLLSCAQESPDSVEDRVSELLDKMTLAKVGKFFQVDFKRYKTKFPSPGYKAVETIHLRFQL